MSAPAWNVEVGETGRTTWTSGPVSITASRSGCVLALITGERGNQVFAILNPDDLQRVVKAVRAGVKTPAGEAIVETLLEAFTRHQHLAICHRLRQRAEVAA